MTELAADGLVLALDQGGHASRALLFDATGLEVAQSQVPVTTRREGPDRVEHDADELADSLRIAAQDVCESADARGREIVAAGLACQRSTIACWDRSDGRALSPAISWQDRRDAGWLERLRPDEAWIRRRTGLVLSPHYGANKLRWCLEQLQPVRTAAFRQRLAAGPLASFLLYRLIEERPVCVDPSNAARMLLFDPQTRDWIPELLAAFGVPLQCLPSLVPTRHRYGRLRVSGRDIPLAACTGDQAAAIFGSGEPGLHEAWLNVGTGAFLQRALAPGMAAADGLLTSVLHSDATTVICSAEGTINGAGSALAWLQSQVALDVERAVQALPAASPRETPVFINGVGGLGAPWWRPAFPIEFVGEGDELARVVAVIESIAFLACANLVLMQQSGTLDSIVITGGLAGSDYLCQSLADLSGLPVARPAAGEATARGMAFIAAGRPSNWPATPIDRRFVPTPNPMLTARHTRWRGEMSRRGA